MANGDYKPQITIRHLYSPQARKESFQLDQPP